MRLRVKILGLNAGDRPIAVIHADNAEDLGIRSLSRVVINHEDKNVVAILNTTKKIVEKGEVGVFDEIVEDMGLKDGISVDVKVAAFPKSIDHIKTKLKGRKLGYTELYQIVKDVVDNRLSEMEISTFVTSLHTNPMDIDEIVDMTKAMVNTGKTLELNAPHIVDKHSIGGVPGDKTTLLVVPIIAACGVTIPKTSSRAITSAAGTADRAETLMPVELDMDEMKTVINKTNACIVWGGALDLAPADDIFIKVEYPFSIDPTMMPSIMSKKLAVGAEHLVIDIPCGRGTKVKTIGDASVLAKDFIEVGNRLGINTQCAITYGEQPIGYAIGAGLEAKEALEVIMRQRSVPDLLEKAKSISTMILNMIGKNGERAVDEVLKSGKAEEKLRQIIFEQGGDSEISPEDIDVGKYGMDFTADRKGYVLWINNHQFALIARAAGSPKNKGAGIQLYKKMGDRVEKGERLFTIYSEKANKLKQAREQLDKDDPMAVGERREMITYKVKESEEDDKSLLFER